MQSIFIAELIGTMLMILLGNGVVANVVLNKTKGQESGWMVITTAWALAVFVGVVVAGPYSGAHLNPAVTLGLALTGSTPWQQVPIYIIGEFLGAALGAALVWLSYKDHFNATTDEATKLACFATAPAIANKTNNFISEVIGTFVLIFVIFFIAEPSLESASLAEAKIGLGSLGALPVAFLVWVIGLSLGGTTGYAINPARDLAPRIVHFLLPIKGDSDWSYAWIPALAPLVGATLAAVIYHLLQ